MIDKIPRPINSLAILLPIATVRFLLHFVINHQYGFHRDALAFLENGMHLSWGYVAYPPFTPFLGRIGLELFGLSPIGIKSFSTLAVSIAMVLAGLIAKEFGGSLRAQIVASIVVAVAPMPLIMGSLFQYITFDYLWWVLIAYFIVRLLNSDDPRWWVGIGIGIGLGAMTKYTIAFYIMGIVVGVLLTKTRHHLQSRWLWIGAAISVLIFLPNLIWQIQNNFISLDFLSAIHERDVAIGRADGYFVQQLYVNTNPFTIPIWIAGLYFLFFAEAGKRYRLMGWMYLVPFILFWLAEGRFYYMAPAYPILLAAGAVMGEQWLTSSIATNRQQTAWRAVYAAVGIATIVGIVLMMPIAPINSALWNNVTSQLHDNYVEQIGWPELTETVARIYEEKSESGQTIGLLAGNQGEVGALNLYGKSSGLPPAISPNNSFWLRGYGNPEPDAVIAVAFSAEWLEPYFARCEVAGKITNSFGVLNETAREHPDILFCTGHRKPWSEIWVEMQRFS